MVNRGIRKLKILITFLVGISGFALMLWFIVPAVHIRVGYVLIALCSAALIALAFLTNPAVQKRTLIVLMLSVFFGLLYFCVPDGFQFKPALNIFQQLVMYTAPFVFSIFLITNLNKEVCYKRLAAVFLLLWLAICAYILFQTLNTMELYPTICRMLASGKESEVLTAFRADNVGGFGFSYAIGILEVFCFSEMLFTKNIKKKMLYLIAVCILLVFIVKTQYATLLILCVLMNYFAVVKRAKSIMTKGILLLVLIVFTLLANVIFLGLSTLVSEERLSERLTQIAYFFSGMEFDSLRLEYFKACWNLFLKSPLIGTVNLWNDQVNRSISANSHSTQMNVLVNVGLLGSFIYNFYLFYLRKSLCYYLKKRGLDTQAFRFCFLFFWLLSWLNPVYEVYDLPFMLFLIVPLLTCFCQKRADNVSPLLAEWR